MSGSRRARVSVLRTSAGPRAIARGPDVCLVHGGACVWLVPGAVACYLASLMPWLSVVASLSVLASETTSA